MRSVARPSRFAIASLLVGAAVLGAGVALAAAGAMPAVADENSLTISSFDAEYRLGRDDGGHSTLAVRETIDASFPEWDANHGLERAIPLDYDGHLLELEIVSVEDGSGEAAQYSRADGDGFAVLRIGSPDAYVHGDERYVLEYTMRDVAHVPDDADLDEFYWDVNGTGWSVPIDRVRATVHLEDGTASAATGAVRCYAGYEGAVEPCASIEQPDERTVVATAGPFGAYQNLTIAIAFAPGTFTPYDRSLLASPLGAAGAAGGLAALGALLAAIVLRVRRWSDDPGRGIVVAQYEPQPDVGALLAAELLGVRARGIAATVLQLAVAGHVRILDERAGGYLLVRGDGEPDDDDALRVLRALFSKKAEPGARRRLEADATLGATLDGMLTGLPGRVLVKGWRRRLPKRPRSALRWIAFVATVLAVFGAVFAGIEQRGGALPVLIAIGAGVLFLVTCWVTRSSTPLTAEGRAAVDHLEGLREYMRLAEADRLKMLQSPGGAERGPGEVLELEERLLPYALLFGMAEQWQRELAPLYARAGVQGAWYDGAGDLDVSRFTSRVAVAQAAPYVASSGSSGSSWSSSSSFSSSSGSSGGGSSGGGGGGGGGGGW